MVAFASRRPDLRLNLQPTDTDEAQFAAGLQKRIEKQQVANDAQYLPKSTNMNLPNHISTGVKYNFEEGEDDSGSGTTAMGNANANGNGSMAQGQGSVKSPIKSHSRNASTAAAATFKRCIPCFFVSHIPTTLPWYKDVLGFQLRGKAESARAELFRSAPGVNRGSDGVSLYLRKVPSPSPSAAASEGRHSSRDPSDAQQAPVPKGSLWIEVDDVDALHQEISSKINHYAQDITDYFPPLHLGSAKIVAKPRNTAWGQREMTTVDDVGNTTIFFQVLS